MISRYFSATTPQHAPVPRACWQISAFGCEHGLDDGPVEKSRQVQQRQSGDDHRRQRALPVGEEIRAQPVDQAGLLDRRRPRRDRLEHCGHRRVALVYAALRAARALEREKSVRRASGGRAPGASTTAATYGPHHLSLIAARLLYQPMIAEVVSDVVRYTAMMIAMHSTARPVWLIAVFEIDTTSG